MHARVCVWVCVVQVVPVVQNPTANVGDRHRFDARIGKIPWRRKWQPTPVFLPGEFHGQRSLAGCTAAHGVPRVRHTLDTTTTTNPIKYI